MTSDESDRTLDELWSDLPVGEAPIEAIRRAALRAEAAAEEAPSGVGTAPRHQRHVRRGLGVVGIAAALGGAFVLGSLTSPGGPGSGGDGVRSDAVNAAFYGELQAPADCDELLAHYVDAARGLVGPEGWVSTQRPTFSSLDRLDGLSTSANLAGAMPRGGFAPQLRDSDGTSLERRSSPRTESQTSSATGTNVQEAGVDEPDNVKTDGEILVRLKDDELTTYDVSGAVIRKVGALDLDGFAGGEILLAGDTVVAIGNDGTPAPGGGYDDYGNPTRSPQTRVLTIDVADPAAPSLTHTVDYDTALVSARQHGDDVRLVLSSGLPGLDFVTPGDGVTEDEARRTNQQVVRDSTIEDWLPRVSLDEGKASGFLDCADVAIPRAGLALDTMAVVGFAATTPGDLAGLGLAGSAPLTYESPDHLYLAASGQPSNDFCLDFCGFARVGAGTSDAARAEDLGTTHVYDFAIGGTRSTYVGAGEVEGAIADRWAMDEHQGVLRLAVGPTSETGDFNSIVTLEPREGAEGQELSEIGRLDEIGPGEDIKSVRWFDGLALVVTFRQTDPLYAIDLSKQRAPRLMGELELPGFSAYLHPLGQRRVLGIGEGPGAQGYGAQAGLLDVTDLATPTRIDVAEYGRGTTALAGQDPRQFTWLPDQRTALTVIDDADGRSRTGYVSVLRLGGGTLANQMVRVEYGNDVDQVRLVPLASGKVALVTGESVRYFPEAD